MRIAIAIAAALVVLSFNAGPVRFTEASADPIAVIVHKSNSVQNLSHKALARLYSGKARRWKNGEKVVIINRPIQSEIRSKFYKVILKAKPSKRFFKRNSPLRFKTIQLNSDLATRKFVSQIPNAVGYIYLSEVDDTVHVLSIDGIPPGKRGYKLN